MEFKDANIKIVLRKKLIIVILDQGLTKNIKEIVVNYNSNNITIIEYGCSTCNNI